jgi:hypothetical protein
MLRLHIKYAISRKIPYSHLSRLLKVGLGEIGRTIIEMRKDGNLELKPDGSYYISKCRLTHISHNKCGEIYDKLVPHIPIRCIRLDDIRWIVSERDFGCYGVWCARYVVNPEKTRLEKYPWRDISAWLNFTLYDYNRPVKDLVNQMRKSFQFELDRIDHHFGRNLPPRNPALDYPPELMIYHND